MAECSDDWVMLDSDNPAESSDDDLVLALSSSCTTPACSDSDSDSDEEEEVGSDADCDDLYGGELEEEESPCPPPQRPLSGLFYHTATSREPGYLAFDAIRSAKHLIPDPRFSAFPEPVAVLASTRGLVCVRGETTGFYYVANPATFRRVRLPRHTREHVDPAVVITFEDPNPNASASVSCFGGVGVGLEHYHVVVAFNLGDGIWAFESFSSRTWKWRASSGISIVERVESSSGVGAHGRAFWRTSIGFVLYYDPEKGYPHEFPAPSEVEERPFWEIGEMEGNLCVTCMDQRVTEVAVLNLDMDVLAADGVGSWSWTGQFEGGRLRNREGAELLRSQGMAEVVMWDPSEERVVAMDLEGRTTRNIGPLTGEDYSRGFIPYVASIAEISSDQMSSKCRASAADANTPNLGAADATTLNNLAAPAAQVH
uniref:F-box associated domain-containing protein n=1 Tax=Oryza punctata TaxID=4537 RepID=A0A0E0MPX2_ORYPU